MKVFVSTKETQGQRKSDFCWTTDGELVIFGMVCDKDKRAQTADGGCGCGRSLVGMTSQKATTTFKVVDMDISHQDFREAYCNHLRDGGWPVPALKVYAKEVDDFLAIANSFPVGAIVELRKGNYGMRRTVEPLKGKLTSLELVKLLNDIEKIDSREFLKISQEFNAAEQVWEVTLAVEKGGLIAEQLFTDSMRNGLMSHWGWSEKFQ